MSLGKNIQFLRKQKKITQEQFAEMMGVSRQAVSRWESDEIVPELTKITQMGDIFACKLDALIKEDLSSQAEIYSDVVVKLVKGFTMARYVMISPNPEDDVNHYMKEWAYKSGLLTVQPDAKLIGWDFPFVTPEQQNRFRLRGYVAAYVLPEHFQPDCCGVEIAGQGDEHYAVITINDPFAAPFERIPSGYQRILHYLKDNGYKQKMVEDVLSCFEHVYQADGITLMDVYINVLK